MNCNHDLTERRLAAMEEGCCPFCLVTLKTALEETLQEIVDLKPSYAELKAINAELLEAAIAFEACLSTDCDCDERARLCAAIAKAKGEA